MEEEVVLFAPRCPGFFAVHAAAILALIEHEKPPNPTRGQRLDTTFVLHDMMLEGCHLLGKGKTSRDELLKIIANSESSSDNNIEHTIFLEKEDVVLRWKVMPEFWAETVIYIAPSDNVTAHMEHLTQGGEFLLMSGLSSLTQASSNVTRSKSQTVFAVSEKSTGGPVSPKLHKKDVEIKTLLARDLNIARPQHVINRRANQKARTNPASLRKERRHAQQKQHDNITSIANSGQRHGRCCWSSKNGGEHPNLLLMRHSLK
ncbi:hypothetical protein ACQ4PT_035276 [Festuca glaucescens]